MPLWLRKFTFNKIKEFYDKEKEAYEEKHNLPTENPKLKQIAAPTKNKFVSKKSK